MRKTVHGYLSMGRIQIPPLPQGIVLTDRDDGTLWLLSHNVTEQSIDDNGYVSITDTIPRVVDHRVYSATEGPIIQINNGPFMRLLVRGSRLGVEVVEDFPAYQSDFDNAPTLTRRGVHRWTNLLFPPISWQEDGNVLAWWPQEI